MWLFTKYGFFSAVCARQDDGKHGRSVDPTRIMVRARVRKHLEELQQRFPELIGDCKVGEFIGSDYTYRIFVGKPIWTKVLVGLNEEIDYDNFKAEVESLRGKDPYERSLHNVWSVMYRLQK
ncbi:MAG TPA: hypothetical protein VH575_19490 [Gemmataceae bacterium]|jgi:hypothetical protein